MTFADGGKITETAVG